jgi:hypothetical protein
MSAITFLVFVVVIVGVAPLLFFYYTVCQYLFKNVF